MALPSNVSLVRLIGNYCDYAGNPIAGSVKFTSSTTLRDMLADTIVVASTSTATLDSNGNFSVVLPATNDPELSDVFTYRVEESFTGGRSYSLSLPVDIPSDRTNIVFNPSFETNTNGWAANRCTLAQSSTYAAIGTYSLRATVSSVGSDQYVDGNTGVSNFAVTSGNTYTASVYVYTPATNTADTAFVLQMHPNNGVSYGAPYSGTSTTVTRGSWTRLSVTFTPTTVNSLPVTTVLFRILSSASLAIGQVFYIDGALLEQSSVLNSYFDGSTDGIGGTTSWNGTAHNATSFLDTDVRTNLCENPSFETDLTGWTGYYTSTRTRVTNQSTSYGSAAMSVQITNVSLGVSNGTIFMPSTIVPSGTTVTISAYIKGTANRIVRFGGRPSDSAGGYLTEDNGGINVTLTGSWQRMSTSYTYTGTGFKPGLQIYITSANFVGTDTFYIDAVSVETGSTLYPYFDGNSTYGSWTGTANLSTSKITRNLLEMSDLAPSFVVSPTYYSFVSATNWAVLDATVQDMDTKVVQSIGAFATSAPAATYNDFANSMATYSIIPTYYPTYASIATLNMLIYASALTPYVTQAQTQQANAESSLASAQVSLSSMLAENDSRLDDFMIVGA